MTIRITGMNSGLDTESIITELASARSTKVEKIEKEKTKLEWKIDAWKDLNSKIYSLYTDVLSDLRFDYAYSKKTTKVSDPNALTVITSGNAMNGTQELKVTQMAKTGYLTGGQLKVKADSNGNEAVASGSTLLSNLKGMDWLGNAGQTAAFKVKVNGEEKKIELTGEDTLNDVANKFKEAGLDARFDEKTGRLFVASKETGKQADFQIELALTEVKEPVYAKELKAWDDTVWNNLSVDDKKALIGTLGEDDFDEGTSRDEIINTIETMDHSTDGLTDDELAAREEAIKKAKKKVEEAYDNQKKSVEEANADLKKNYEAQMAKLPEIQAQEKENFTKAICGLGLMTEKMVENLAKPENGGISLGDYGISKDNVNWAYKTDGQDAHIELNGAKFEFSSNTFEINGLTITAHKETGDTPVILTTEQDTSGIYDMIKNFITKYNELINEMDKLYNAESASKYEPLTKDEKDAMSETEIEEWEKKIKDSLLRRDSTLSSVSNAMKQVMIEGVNVNGKQIYLSMFGIETLGYFKAKDNEKNAYHIDGDPDDSSVKNNEDKLRAAIASDPDTVIEFFKQLSTNLYNKLDEKMARTDYSSSFTVYNDKQMEKDLKDYESKVKTAQDKLNEYTDKWYKKFSQMEVALSKLNSKESSISSLFG